MRNVARVAPQLTGWVVTVAACVIAVAVAARAAPWLARRQRVTRKRNVAPITLRLAGWLVSLALLTAVMGLIAVMVGPRLLGWQGVIVLTGSMEPTLKVGGLAFVEPTTDAESVQVGDVIAFRSLKNPNQQISHRVIEIINDADGLGFRTKGDNSELADQQLVRADNLLGKVRFHLPYLGYAADKLRHRESFYLFLSIPAGLLVINEIFNIWRGLRRGRKETAT